MRKQLLCRCLLALLAAVVAVPLVRAGEPAKLKKITSIEGITEYRLDNGLQVLLFPDDSRPTVTINLTVFVGSRHEGYGEAGMAHLLEHMVFKGTPTHKDIPKQLQKRGAVFNGTTSYDRTNYFETLPAKDDNLEWGIRFEADRLVNSYVKREDLVKEMTVVRNEFEAGENFPIAVLFQRMMSAAYSWHNYGKSVIGNRSDIERVPIERLQAFYKKYYQPDNAMLVVAGQFDEKQALGYIEKYFGAIPQPKRKLPNTYTEEPAQDGERLVTLRRVGDVGAMGAVHHIPAGPHDDYPAVSVLANILSSQPSGRLYEALVKTKKATSVFAFSQGMHDPGVLMILAQVPRSNSLDEVRDIMLNEIQKVVDKGVTKEEVDRARRQILVQREQAATNTSQLAIMLSNWASQGDWRLYFLYRDRVEKVTPEDIKRVAGAYLQQSNRTVGMFLPQDKPMRVAIPATPDVKALVKDYKGREDIARGENFDVSPANIEARTKHSKLPEGIKVSLLAKKTRGETVDLHLSLRYGNEDNLKEVKTATSFLPQLMTRGTKKYNYEELRDELDKRKARLSGSGGPGLATFSIHTKKKHLPAVLELLRQVLREPTLPEEEFEVLRRQTLAGLEQQRNDPSTQALLSVSRRLSPYGKDNIRYVPTVDEEIAATKAVTLAQVQKLYKEYLGSQVGELTIVGDFDAKESLAILSDTLSGWKAAKPYARIVSVAPQKIDGGKEKIHIPDKANANYYASLILPINDEHPDYPALLLANQVLGGGFSSRIVDRVRHKEGLSYSAGSSLIASAQDKRTTFGVRAICNPLNIKKVEIAIREELVKFANEGLTKEELDRARDGYLEQQRVRRTNDGLLATLLGNNHYRGRTMTHEAKLEKKLLTVTPEEVQEAFRKHIDVNKLVIAIAGDFKKPGTGGR
jgi:zinc protease